MNIIKVIENVARYSLIIIFVLIFSGSIFTSIMNPETYFFGGKLGGTTAIIYLLIEGIAGTMIAYLLIKKRGEGEILSVLYFGYFFIETLVTNLSFGFGLLVSPLFTVGFHYQW